MKSCKGFLFDSDEREKMTKGKIKAIPPRSSPGGSRY